MTPVVTEEGLTARELRLASLCADIRASASTSIQEDAIFQLARTCAGWPLRRKSEAVPGFVAWLLDEYGLKGGP